ncbi:hypothetical protein [Mycobacterium basiliense]|uniref:hypothetical protein n=1 Tax=Mycobacterium basiliense TaxID=2094119 RepID=UPI001301633F|nr:hypothetical protein [Mycobacterium basiliense]
MATEAELTRWGKVLEQIVTTYDMKPSGVRLLVESGKPVPPHAWPVINLAIMAPLVDLWQANAPRTGSQLYEWIRPAYAVAIALDQTSPDSTPIVEFMALVRDAREKVQNATASESNQTEDLTDETTVDGVLKDLELDVKLAVLSARLGHNGIMHLIDRRIAEAGRAATRREQPPPPQLDLVSLESVDQLSYRTMSHAEIRTMADPGVMTTEEFIAGDQLADRAPILKYFASLWVTHLITQWDELYRPLLARLHGADPDDVVSELFADLNKFRQDYVHNRGVATSRSSKNKRLNWFSRGDAMIPTSANYDQLLHELHRELPLLAHQPVPKARPNRSAIKGEVPTELVKLFEKAAGARGLGVSAALEAAIKNWIDESDGPGGQA